MSTIAELAETYRSGAAALRAAVAGMSAEAIRARPIPGRWSTLEVVAHIADFEPVFADRIQRIIALDTPTLLAADENLFVERLHYQDRDLDEELAVVESIRRKIARLISHLQPDDLQRIGTHSLKGPQTLEKVIQMSSQHIPHHLPFIAEKRRALGIE